MLDIFNNSAFDVTRLTQAINEIAFAPGRVAELGIFNTESVDTTTIAVEKQGDSLIIVPPTPRGGPGVTVDKDKRDMRPLIIPHFEINDAIYAEEVQGVRAFGTEQALETVIGKVAQRQAKHVRSLAVTEEYARMGAIGGIVTYKGGQTLNLFNEFGVSARAEIDFDLDNASPAEGALRKKCAGVSRATSNELGGIPYTGLWAFCGDNFFDDLLSHPEVRETYKGWGEARILREGYVGPNRSTYGIFEFGGIVWENYRGAVVDGQEFIGTEKCKIFPTGAPDLFKTVYAPADLEETVNTLGQRLYSNQYAMQNGKGRHLDVQMNALQYCSRPRALVGGKRT